MNKLTLWPAAFIFCAILFDPVKVGAANSREAVINEALNCVSTHWDEDISWQDICYTTTSSAAHESEVGHELDYYEKHHNYIRQDQFEDSLGYLESFLTNEGVAASSLSTSEYYASDETHDDFVMPPLPKIDYKFTREQYKESSRFLKGKFSVLSGYRRDKLHWDIAGDLQGTDPNVFAEYEFSKLNMNVIKAKGSLILADHFVVDGSAAYGAIFNGVNQVTEYDGNNKTDLAVKTQNSSDGHKVLDVSAALGYRVDIAESDVISQMFELNNLYLTFLAGYSQHEQDLDITDGVTTIDNTPTPELGPFDGLHSSYFARWKGPFLGLEIEGQKNRLTGLFRLEYHLADYYGWGQSNLRPEFQQPKSFEHVSDGNGWVVNLGLGYQLTRYFSLDFLGDLQLWNAKEGVDRLFLPGGAIAEERQLNGVDWESYALMLGGTLRFR